MNSFYFLSQSAKINAGSSVVVETNKVSNITLKSAVDGVTLDENGVLTVSSLVPVGTRISVIATTNESSYVIEKTFVVEVQNVVKTYKTLLIDLTDISNYVILETSSGNMMPADRVYIDGIKIEQFVSTGSYLLIEKNIIKNVITNGLIEISVISDGVDYIYEALVY